MTIVAIGVVFVLVAALARVMPTTLEVGSVDVAKALEGTFDDIVVSTSGMPLPLP